MTDAELQGIAAQALNLAKRDAEQGGFSVLLASFHEGEGLHRMCSIEALLEERLGKGWLNDGRRKDYAFAVLQLSCCTKPPDAMAMVTVCNAFRPTEALLRCSREEQKALMDRGHKYHHQMVKDGLLTVEDVLLASAQTAERVCIYNLSLNDYLHDRGQPEIMFFDQANYEGRTKFYGRTKEDILRQLGGVE